MTDSPTLALTRRNYDAMAQRYADWVPAVFAEQTFDLAMLRAFAELVGGQGNPNTLDVGCGPGHVTDWLTRTGLPVRGIDLSPVMVDLARRAHPDLRFDEGSMLDLDVADASAGGVLAYFSIIHTPPADLPTALAEFARVLTPGGFLLLAFQTGDDGQAGWKAFDHKVSPAFCWSVDAVADLLTGAGLGGIGPHADRTRTVGPVRRWASSGAQAGLIAVMRSGQKVPFARFVCNPGHRYPQGFPTNRIQ